MGLKAQVLKKVSDNFIKEPTAHFIPSGKAGEKICRSEGYGDYFRTRVEFQKKTKPSYIVMMNDKFDQRILMKDLEKKRAKGSKVDPNYAAQILVSQSYIKNAEALCRD